MKLQLFQCDNVFHLEETKYCTISYKNICMLLKFMCLTLCCLHLNFRVCGCNNWKKESSNNCLNKIFMRIWISRSVFSCFWNHLKQFKQKVLYIVRFRFHHKSLFHYWHKLKKLNFCIFDMFQYKIDLNTAYDSETQLSLK